MPKRKQRQPDSSTQIVTESNIKSPTHMVDGEYIKLQSDDIVVFMTDGIIETMDSDDNYYADSGRLETTISQFTTDMPAEVMVDAIINDAIDYSGDKSQRDDDMTVVVAKVL